MAVKKVVELKNNVGVPSKIWVEGDNGRVDEYVIPPFEVGQFEPDIAKKFLDECGGTVVEYSVDSVPGKPGEPQVWIANGTGNPYLPREIILPSFKEGEPAIRAPNPNLEPLELSWRLPTTEERPNGPDSYDTIHRRGPLIRLPPYERLSVPESVARWVVQRDELQPPHRKGKVIYCRAPGEFEPNRLWGLDDMITYAALIDRTYFNDERLKEKFPPEAAYAGNPNALREAKLQFWPFLFHMIIEKRRTLPPRGAFEQAKRKLETALKSVVGKVK